MKAPITQAQAWAVIAESAGWNAKELPVLPAHIADVLVITGPSTHKHMQAGQYYYTSSQLQAYGAACAAHAREMALSDAELLDFVESHPHLTLRNHKKRWSFVGMTNYEYATFDTARAAIKATIEASEY